jgi:transposase
MQDKELYQQILGIKAPWFVKDVKLEVASKTVKIILGHERGAKFTCSECGKESTVYDHRKRQWRHLDTCDFLTIIEADIPRISCPNHQIKQVNVPWAESGSGFTAMFEAVAISWLQVTTTAAVAEHMKISWDETWGIVERAVRRGEARRKPEAITQLAIDETSFQKRHEYVTVLVDRA